MKSKLLGIALFGLTLGTVVYYPQLMAKNIQIDPPIQHHIVANENPKVDVVFVLDTTGSMGGLIQTAKEKIWSIATTMASAQQTPEIRIGLVAYRDRGDSYVTKVVDLSDDLDSVYATLMDFEAQGGGDTPESVNKALYDAVHEMSWSEQDQAYQVIFLVGDAPPHMDYNEIRYPEIVATAEQKGIVINTIQCGSIPSAIEPWTQIASLGHGNFFQVDQAGGAVAYTTPFDEDIAKLSAKLDDTRLYYGTEEVKTKMRDKVAATEKLHEGASYASRARRGVFNASEGGRTNLLGENELVAAVASGTVDLNKLEEDALPEALKPMAPAAQEAFVAELAEERADLQRQIRKLSEDRDGYLAKKVDEAGGLKDSLDQKLYDAVKEQAGKAGLEYEDGPTY
ncbi:MAG: VWA domain-containing protein [Gammaproteobacteria bacterium]|nr:VWA domain-containing protein [Gammaproteobacteria bacterium]